VLAEYGEISAKGRYKGMPSPYGMGIIEISKPEIKTNISALILEYCNRLLDNKNDLKECGVDDIIFDIERSKDAPAEILLSTNILRNLSALNATVEFHTIENAGNLKNKIA
jgi:hypothetical protein